ncbi:hypothetical protein, partial [Enterocloster bolteae]
HGNNHQRGIRHDAAVGRDDRMKHKMHDGMRDVYQPWSKEDVERMYRRTVAEYRKRMNAREEGKR